MKYDRTRGTPCPQGFYMDEMTTDTVLDLFPELLDPETWKKALPAIVWRTKSNREMDPEDPAGCLDAFLEASEAGSIALSAPVLCAWPGLGWAVNCLFGQPKESRSAAILARGQRKGFA